MLQVSGKVLGVTDETVNMPSGSSFVSTTVHVLDGVRVHEVRLGRDFPTADRPKEGDSTTIEVEVSVFQGRNGAGYRLTGLRLASASAGARVKAV